jgi:hypothetical protein
MGYDMQGVPGTSNDRLEHLRLSLDRAVRR